jgi:hypothetical protein|tara:strand:+ start:757 stop:939 length:183 start_codon:yes stop_codon:yes gene_type:complete
MERFIDRFCGDEVGNAAIDWIVLTAGMVLFGAAVMTSISPMTDDLALDATDADFQIEMGL